MGLKWYLFREAASWEMVDTFFLEIGIANKMLNYGAQQRKNWRNRLYYFHHAVEINQTYIMAEPFEKALLGVF